MAFNQTILEVLIRIKDEASKTINNFNRDTAKIAGAVSLIGIATGLAIKSSIEDFSEFDTEIQRAGANVDASKETIKKFKEVAIKAAEDSKVTAKEAANALFFLAGGNISAEEAAANLGNTIEFATANQIDLQQATLLTSQAMTLFKQKNEDLIETMDVLTKAGQIAYATSTQIGDAFSEIASTAGGLGVNIIDLTSVIGAMADAGIVGSEAGVALKRAYKEILHPSSQMEEAMDHLGISAKDLKTRLSDPIELVRFLQTKFEDIKDPIERAAEVTKLFGDISGPAMVALIGMGSDAIEDYRIRLSDSSGTMQEAADRINSAMSPFAKLGEKIQQVKFAIAEALQPSLEKLYEFMKPVIDKIVEFASKHPKLITLILMVVVALGALAAAMLTIMGIITLVTASGFGAFGILIAGIVAAVVALAATIFIYWNEIKNITISIWNFIKDFFKQIWGGIKIVFDEKIKSISEAWDKIWDKIKNILKTALAFIVGLIAVTLDKLIPNWEEKLGVIFSIIDEYVALIKNIWSGMWGYIESVFIEKWNTIKNVLMVIKTVWENIWSTIKSVFHKIWDAIVGKIENAVEKIKKAIEPVIELISKVRSAANKIKGGVGDWVGGVISRGRGILGFQKGGVGNFGSGTLAMLHGQEAVIPLNRLGANGIGGNVININLSGSFFTTREVAEFWAEEIIRNVKRHIKI